MSWGNPWLFGFLALIPLILLLHSLRFKRQEVRVTTLFLWERLLQERKATLGISRIVKSLTLLLQILVVSLLTIGLAQPFLSLPATREGDMVLIIDTSASMQAQGPQGTRFALAQAEAYRLIDQLHEKSRMAIIEAGQGPVLRTFFTRDKRRLREIVARMEAGDSIGNLRESVLLALSLLRGQRQDHIVVISDGTETDWQAELPAGVRITPLQVQAGEKNIGITRFAFRQGWGETPRYEMLVTIQNFTPVPVNVPLKVTINRRRLLQEEVSLQGGEVRTLVYPFTRELHGVVEARLLFQDDFPLDNVARTVLTRARSFWVLLISPGNYFLENLLAAHPYA
ncbi:MAG: VWA domain-containing protein, partial [Nitrospinota bacterium]